MRIVAAIAVLALPGVAAAQLLGSAPTCPAPSYFGICDPYVPGVFIGPDDAGLISVVSTWHNGPAEKAGVCPGDKIVAINGGRSTGTNFADLLRAIVSDSPSPIVLRIRRGSGEFDVRTARVRESALAALSGQKFVGTIASRATAPPDGYPSLVAKDVSAENWQNLMRFRDRLLVSTGFKRVGPMEVPAATPESQVKELQDALTKFQSTVRFVNAGVAAYSPGFTAFVVHEPPRVLVHSILPGTPAHKAGLWAGDEIVAVNGHSTESMSVGDLGRALSQAGEITLQVKRSDGTRDLKMKSLPTAELLQTEIDRPVPEPPRLAGDRMTGVAAVYDNERHQAIVANVFYPSPAFSAGVYPGDMIVDVQKTPIDKFNGQQFGKALAPGTPEPILLSLVRSGREFRLRLTPVTYAGALASIGRRLTQFGPAPIHCPG